LSDFFGLRRASSAFLGLNVRDAVKSSIESRSARGQNPVLRTLSERAIHSTISPLKYA
jgi:hypothetical protein